MAEQLDNTHTIDDGPDAADERERRRLAAGVNVPPPRELSDDDRRQGMKMLDQCQSRIGRLLVMLVELEGVPLERAAAALNLTTAQGRERLASLRTIVRALDRHAENEADLARRFGTADKERRKLKPKASWRQGRRSDADAS